MPRTTLQLHYKTKDSKPGSAFAVTGVLAHLGWEIERAFIGPVIEHIDATQSADESLSSQVEVVFRISKDFYPERLQKKAITDECQKLGQSVRIALKEGGHLIDSCEAVALEDLYGSSPIRFAAQIEIADMPGALSSVLRALRLIKKEYEVAEKPVRMTLDGLLCCPLHVSVRGDSKGIIHARFSPYAEGDGQKAEFKLNAERVANAICRSLDAALENCFGVRAWSLVATSPRLTAVTGVRGNDDFTIKSDVPSNTLYNDDNRELLYYRSEKGNLPGVAARIADFLSDKGCDIRRMAMVERVAKRGARVKCGSVRMRTNKLTAKTLKDEIRDDIAKLTAEVRTRYNIQPGVSTFDWANEDKANSGVTMVAQSGSFPVRFSCQLAVLTPADQNGFARTLNDVFGRLFSADLMFNVEHLIAFRRYAYNSPQHSSHTEYLIDIQFSLVDGDFKTNESHFDQAKKIRTISELTEWLVIRLSEISPVSEVYCHSVDSPLEPQCPIIRATRIERWRL